MQLGTIILYKNIDSFLSSIQRKVLDTIYSHSSIYKGKDELDRGIEFEANLQVGQTTYRTNLRNMDQFELMFTDGVDMKQILNELVDEYEGVTYGFMSWPAILIRVILEKILPSPYNKRVKKWNILWGWGVICSELVWYYFEKLATVMIRKTKLPAWGYFLYDLKTYNPNLFTPEDIKNLLMKHNTIWRKKNVYSPL